MACSAYIDQDEKEIQSALLTGIRCNTAMYRIEKREKRRPKALEPEDLETVAYMFLSRDDFRELALEA